MQSYKIKPCDLKRGERLLIEKNVMRARLENLEDKIRTLECDTSAVSAVGDGNSVVGGYIGNCGECGGGSCGENCGGNCGISVGTGEKFAEGGVKKSDKSAEKGGACHSGCDGGGGNESESGWKADCKKGGCNGGDDAKFAYENNSADGKAKIVQRRDFASAKPHRLGAASLKATATQKFGYENNSAVATELQDNENSFKATTAELCGFEGNGNAKSGYVEKNAVATELLKREYRALACELRSLERGLSLLDEQSRAVLDVFYVNRAPGAADRLCELLNLERSHVYRLKVRALEKFCGAMPFSSSTTDED